MKKIMDSAARGACDDSYVSCADAYPASADRAAKREGWALFTADDGTLQIEKHDAASAFDNDADAVAFVVARALEGSVRHLRALFLVGHQATARVYLDGKLGGAA